MKKQKYLQYIRIKYIQLSAQYLSELLYGKNTSLLKALNGVLTTLDLEQKDSNNASSKHIGKTEV